MGLLVDGIWQDQWYDTKKSQGKFVRSEAKFRNWLVPAGKEAPSGRAFEAKAHRYHLYVALACPWAHRTLIFRKLKGLEDMIAVSTVHPLMAEHGWTFEKHEDGFVKDSLFGSKFMHEIYTRADPKFSGRVTVPLLWDTFENTVVSNESSEIIRMFNTAFDGLGAKAGDFYPEPHRAEIDDVNHRIYHTLNNGVYKSGFATTQEAYEAAVFPLFETLEWLEERLSRRRYLVGDSITEADWRLFTTLVRFDAVYVGHFKTNLKRLVDFPNIWNYTRELYQVPGVAETVNMKHIKGHYYRSHESVNPHRIVPAGPVLNFEKAHGRDALS